MTSNCKAPAGTTVGHIYLKVIDLGRTLKFYRDRPKDEWGYTEEGSVKMVTKPLDLQDLLNELD